jgi:hypothetical protein
VKNEKKPKRRREEEKEKEKAHSGMMITKDKGESIIHQWYGTLHVYRNSNH